MEFPENLKDPSQWAYRGEGGATIVISSQVEDIVLRLKKTPPNSSMSTANENLPSRGSTDVYVEQTEQATHSLDFQKNIFQPLMGNEYVRVGNLVKIPAGFLAEVDRLCQSHRPTHRLDKVIDQQSSVGVFMPDFCFLQRERRTSLFARDRNGSTETENPRKVSEGAPTFCVEIKPKCGYLPVSPFVPAERRIKCNICHYCMLQRSKVKEGKYSRESRFCPVDLFSGNVDQVFFALESLVRDPQNNFRVFKDGCLVFSEELIKFSPNSKDMICASNFLECALQGLFQSDSSTSSISVETNSFCLGQNSRFLLEILVQILVHDSGVNKSLARVTNSTSFPAMQQCKKSKFDPDSFHQVNVKIRKLTFQGGGVLQKLLAIQRLDDLEVEALHVLYKKIMKCFSKQPQLRKDLGVDGPYGLNVWKSTVAASKGLKLDDVKINHLREHESLKESSFQLCRGILEDRFSVQDDDGAFNFAILKICHFLIASTAKDCSIMVTFQKCSAAPSCSKTHWIQETSTGDFYCYNIDLVDLDPKEFDRVPKYFRDSLNAVQNYI